MIFTDVLAIEKAIPVTYLEKKHDMSLIHFASLCGARAGTCANVHISDIQTVTKLDGDDSIFIFIIILIHIKIYGILMSVKEP